ncbi:MAG: hypothetical protein JRI86_14300 [Deltaproteobacteria bacterium]|nr:hypothetical protein [Deltaproteobacteria bacterium]
MVALVGGIAALILGIIGLIGWWGSFLIILKGSVPIILILGGALAVYLGMEEIKEGKTSEIPAENTDELKTEVENLKEELKELKEEKMDLDGDAKPEEKKEEEK